MGVGARANKCGTGLATGNKVEFSFSQPKQITQTGRPQGSSGTEVPPPKNANTQHNENSSDPEGLDDMLKVTQLTSGGASIGQSSTTEQLSTSSEARLPTFLSWLYHTRIYRPGQVTHEFCTSVS